MAVAARLKKYLDEAGVHYSVLIHSEVFTAQETAQKLHVPGREVAKTVIVKSGDRLGMVVVPAHHRVDLDSLSREMGEESVRVATEEEFRGLFPGCEVGAMPPFGNLYEMPVWVSEPLTWDEDIVFNCGTHTDVIRMKYLDYARLVGPRVAMVSYPAGATRTRLAGG